MSRESRRPQDRFAAGSGVPCLLLPGWGALGQVACSLFLSFSTCELDSTWLRCRSAEGPSRRSPPHRTHCLGALLTVCPFPILSCCSLCSLEMGQHSVAGAAGCWLSHHFLLGPVPSSMLSGDFPGLPRTSKQGWGWGVTPGPAKQGQRCVWTRWSIPWRGFKSHVLSPPAKKP